MHDECMLCVCVCARACSLPLVRLWLVRAIVCFVGNRFIGNNNLFSVLNAICPSIAFCKPVCLSAVCTCQLVSPIYECDGCMKL
jgi:hypothetical protein